MFQEAPIAYVIEDVDSRLVSANSCALRILGLEPEEVTGTFIKSLIPNTPDAQRRLDEALSSVGHGTETSGRVLELRRRDDDRPVWVQWWSKPEPDANFRRTMFIDITERVLAEQERNRLEQQNAYLVEELKSVHNFEEIIGRGAALTKVLDDVRLVAPTDASVLITGETGSGKELIARAIHSLSSRRNKPLIKVNCAALPTGLVESELFGHEKGAFTGAIQKRIGRFELAEGGTIFLDEIGELPLDVQAKLLRVLQEREFERIGGNRTIQVDVRVIAATNRDLRKAIRHKLFREDLYYRLSVFPVKLPPLRERTEDIPLLVEFLVQKFALRAGKRLEGISAESIELLQSYSWPGNVRELENVLERAVILCREPVLEIDPMLLSDDNLSPLPGFDARETDPSTLREVERQHIRTVLEQTEGVIEGSGGAAAILGLNPSTLRSRLKKLGIALAAVNRGAAKCRGVMRALLRRQTEIDLPFAIATPSGASLPVGRCGPPRLWHRVRFRAIDHRRCRHASHHSCVRLRGWPDHQTGGEALRSVDRRNRPCCGGRHYFGRAPAFGPIGS